MTKYMIQGCEGCQACAVMHPENFAIGDDRKSYIKSQPTKEVVDKIGCDHIKEIKDEN